MKTFFAAASLLLSLALTAHSGPSPTFEKGSTTSVETPGWYASREFNVQLWGAYAFSANEYRQDRYMKADHGWGGGLGMKYFLNRYVGVGLEGYAVSRTSSFGYVTLFPGSGGFIEETLHDTGTIGAGLATVTLRYPIGASRFAPYAFAGGGIITGGSQQLRFESVNPGGMPGGTNPWRAYTDDSQTEAIVQFGGGLEIRLTPHIGLINDFSWTVVNLRDNNFGMARTGINFAF
jgi:hypothetical protein